jgi:hypothetical protein
VGKSQANNMKAEERMTGNYYQNVSTILLILLNKHEIVLSEVKTITVQYFFPSLVLRLCATAMEISYFEIV